MVQLTELIAYVDTLLDSRAFKDYCPNGLHVEGRATVRKIVTGVTACQALIDQAVEHGADALLVHHGYFWRNEDPCVTGIKRSRLRALLAADMSLIAYHLPLDAHPVYGNNAQLGRVLGLEMELPLTAPQGVAILAQARVPQALSPLAFTQLITDRLGRAPLHIAGSAPLIRRIGWCSGAAQDYIVAAAQAGLDAYLTGEVSEATVHVARETGIHFFAAGHHATERYGVQALGTHLAQQFGLAHTFIDIPNPV